MATSTAARYQHLEPRPGSNYRQRFLKGRRIRAAVVYEAFHGPYARGVRSRLRRAPRLHREQPAVDQIRAGPRGR